MIYFVVYLVSGCLFCDCYLLFVIIIVVVLYFLAECLGRIGMNIGFGYGLIIEKLLSNGM